jgi:hypothetical protein
MHRLLVSLGLAAVVLAAPARAEVGEKPPELKAEKWYHSPPISFGDLQGKAVMIEVFRTW